MSTTTPVTADQLLRMPDDGYRYELVAGELRKMTPAGWRRGAVVSWLHSRLAHYIGQHDLGWGFCAETGSLLARDPDTVRAPDLAVEVLSPGDTVNEVDDKVKAWLDAGAGMVWLVNPKWQNVTVYRSETDITTLTKNDELDGQDGVPGFRCRVGDIFAGK